MSPDPILIAIIATGAIAVVLSANAMGAATSRRTSLARVADAFGVSVEIVIAGEGVGTIVAP
jgi:hypothetical protein